MLERVRTSLTKLGTLTARPSAFLVLFGYVALWLVFSPEEMNWHSVATLATWAMTLMIQRAEHRDTQAIEAKLDELLRVHDDAKNDLINMDEREPEEIERHRKSQSS